MNYAMKIQKENIWKLLYCLALLFFIVSYACGLTSHSFGSVYFLSLTYFTSFCAFIFFFFFAQKSENILYQLLVIYLFVSVFFDLSYFSEYTSKTYLLNILIGGLVINLPAIIMLVYVFKKNLFYKIRKTIKNYWELLVLLFIFILFSYETLNTMTRLDSNIYYTYLQSAKSWDLSFNTISLFKLGGHQSIAYTIWGLIGVYLFPNSAIGIRIVHIFMTCISLLAIYCILKKLLPTKNFVRIILFLATALFAFNPLILGIIYDITLDLPLLCFYLWTLYSLLYNKKIFLFFSSVFLLLSKETGIILLFGIAAGWGIVHLYTTYTQYKSECWKKIDYWTICCMGIPFVIMLLTLCFSGIWRQDKLSAKSSSSKQLMDSFGMNYDNSLIKIKELFLLNFSWIITLLILIFIIILLVKKEKIKVVKKQLVANAMPLLISFLSFVLFQFIYITYCHIRYIMPYLPGFLFLFLLLLIITCSAKQVIVILSIIVTLLFSECFYTTDPVSRQLCDTIDIGSTNICSTRTFVRDSDYTVRTKRTHQNLIEYFQLTQSAIYNRQHLYFLWAFEEFINEIHYDDNTYIAVAPIYENGGNGMTWISLFGRWYSNELFYDTDTNKLTDDTLKTSLNISVIKDNSAVPYNDYERIFLITFPYNSLFDNDSFLNNFEIKNNFVIQKRGWEIQVYQIK